MYNPCFQFPLIPECNRYLFTVTDCNKKIHKFETETPSSLLTPVWNDIPEGVTELKVEALNEKGEPDYQFEWEGKRYSEEDFYEEIDKMFPLEEGVRPSKWYERDEILELMSFGN